MTGRISRAVSACFARAVRDGRLDEVLDGPVMALARSLAIAMDTRAGDPDGNAVGLAKLAAELRQVMVRLRLDPVSRGGEGGDEFDQFLRSLSTPVGNQPDPGAG